MAVQNNLTHPITFLGGLTLIFLRMLENLTMRTLREMN